jgi:hypothetical protein
MEQNSVSTHSALDPQVPWQPHETDRAIENKPTPAAAANRSGNDMVVPDVSQRALRHEAPATGIALARDAVARGMKMVAAATKMPARCRREPGIALDNFRAIR